MLGPDAFDRAAVILAALPQPFTVSEARRALGAVVSGQNRAALAVSGVALLAGSVLQRFGTFEAGAESTRDPKYVVVPQREQLEARRTVPMTKKTR